MSDAPLTIAITGCNTGIGKAAAVELARMGHRIVMLVRDSDKSRAALTEIESAAAGADVSMVCVDLSSQASIREAALEVHGTCELIDVLINNAAVFKTHRELSPDGFEMTLAVNYLAPYLLTKLLLALVQRSRQGRIVNVTSEMYKRGTVELDRIAVRDGDYSGSHAYADSKLLLGIFTRGLAAEFSDSSVTVNCVHPGVVATEVFRDYPAMLVRIANVFFSRPREGARPLVHLATSPELAEVTGRYFYKTDRAEAVRVPDDLEGHIKQIIEFSQQATDPPTV